LLLQENKGYLTTWVKKLEWHFYKNKLCKK
jgi:hypothetical protein